MCDECLPRGLFNGIALFTEMMETPVWIVKAERFDSRRIIETDLPLGFIFIHNSLYRVENLQCGKAKKIGEQKEWKVLGLSRITWLVEAYRKR